MVVADILIIDSGVNLHQALKNNDLIVYTIDNGCLKLMDSPHDDYGHGTTIYNLITKYSPLAKIVNFKLFGQNGITLECELILALQYIRDNFKCKVINMSLGIKMCDELTLLENICAEINSQGTIIVSAFDNEGCFSFPAAFDTVVGVDSSYYCKSAYEFEFVEGSPINVRARGGLQKIKWCDNDAVVGGSSFACAYVTSFIANLLDDKLMSFSEVLSEIKKASKCVHEKKDNEILPVEKFVIKKAALFPFNKEMHSVYRYSALLDFEISKIIDIRQSGRVGSNVKKMIDFAPTDSTNMCDFIIEDINNLDYTGIDTMILGHLDEINRLTQRDFRIDIIKKAMENGVNIFAFDSLAYYIENFEARQNKIYYPIVTVNDVPQNTFGKLYPISKPVIAIFGTSSRQGKFSLQLYLIFKLKEMGYSVGSIGTEAQSKLFGIDFVYPMGYNSSVYVNEYQAITLLNEVLHRLCKNDIIIVSSQSHAISTSFLNTSSISVRQNAFLLGVQPDAVILTINPFDEDLYIANTIKYLEGATNCKIIALVMFPLFSNNDFQRLFNKKRFIDDDDFKIKSSHLAQVFNIPVYLLGDLIHMDSVCNDIINFFC